MPSRKTIGLAAALTVWAACLVTGFAALARYGATAGSSHAPESRATEFLARQHKPGRGLLVMAVHPLCPCTDASLAEFGDLLARSHGACDALIVQYQPAQPSPDWPVGPKTVVLGGVRVPILLDRRGDLANALGADTSGHVVFVDAAGVVRFEGGLTLARGHRGRSPGQDAILAVLDGQPTTLSKAPVFGCALEGECTSPISP